MQSNKAPSPTRTTPSDAESIVPHVALLRQPQVVGAIFPGGSSSLWRHVKAGTFPAPVKISERITAWRREDLVAWLEHHSATAAA